MKEYDCEYDCVDKSYEVIFINFITNGFNVGRELPQI